MNKQQLSMKVRELMKEVILIQTAHTFTYKELVEDFDNNLILSRLNTVYKSTSRVGYSITDYDRLDRLLNGLVRDGLVTKREKARVYTKTKKQKSLTPVQILQLNDKITELENMEVE